MNHEPTRLMQREAERLFGAESAESLQFLDALMSAPDFAPCVLWTGETDALNDFRQHRPLAESDPRLDWLPDFALRLAIGGESPGRDPLHDAGAFYSLDFSSVWAASALLTIPQGPRCVLDLCASPGGKSVFASLALKPEFLLSNEVIGKRLAVLRHNLARCGIAHAFTQRLDPRDLAKLAPGAFEVVIVDAPCSGQSLLAKGIENPGAFHPSTVKGNAKRQVGILSTAAECVTPGGHLLYATCTFAERENERVIARFLDRHPDFSAQPVPHLEPWRSTLAEFPAYRLYPHSGLGAGAFTCLLRRDGLPSAGTPTELDPSLIAYPVAQ
ncbi:MAG: RsmB/NOP family class I SAM-dependent RNA methyltransferase [Verrucomicrobiae bacterium]|nr:RsmB/NOP family class I SAM-dependent RNA methyltransferase [Verrucomicrobiae bacterium]